MTQQSERRLLQSRRIVCEGFKRADGLYEVEAQLVDVKPYAVSVGDRGEIAAGEPFHEMRLRVTVDEGFLIHEAEATTVLAPYRDCASINQTYGRLVGLRLGPGFHKQVRERFAGSAGCTHLTELIPAVVTTAMQTIWHVLDQLDLPLEARTPRLPNGEQPAEVGGCHALRTEGEAVRRHYPQFYRHPTDRQPESSAGVLPGSTSRAGALDTLTNDRSMLLSESASVSVKEG